MEDGSKPANVANQKSDPQTAPLAAILDSHSNKNQNNTSPDKSHWRDPMSWLLLGTLFATAAAACYTKKQWETAVDSEQRQVRAYVSLRDIRLEKRNDDSFDIIPEWENTGSSETVGMRGGINRHMLNMDMPAGFSYTDLSTEKVPIILGPKSVLNIAFMQIAKQCLAQFNRRDEFSKFYIWGWTTYNDTLTNEPHQTRFCWDVNQVVFSSDGRSARLSHGLCNEGNCADKQCTTPEKQTIHLSNTNCKPEPPTPVAPAVEPKKTTKPPNPQ